MDIILIIILSCIAIYIALLPIIIAKGNNHYQFAAIAACNIIGLFTGIFWLVALIWSLTNNPSKGE
ncbi:TMhelix containing protein [Vibrio phage 1.105.O._10N.286.49.B4]|nr:TMhelix containing protein [Vibrio phage 1.105.O._10N.286.49.B4]